MENISWVKIDSWHIAESTTTDGNVWTVHTRCGLDRTWDGVSLDRLPGGSEKSCENCLIGAAGDTLNVAPPAKKTRKTK